MDPIKTFISDVVPGLTVEKLDIVLKAVNNHGFTELEQLKYLDPEIDLKDELNTLQRRILKEKLQQQQKVVAAPEAADIGI